MKNPLIDVKINSLKTATLIEDIKTFCLNTGLVLSDVNEFAICEKIEAQLPAIIEIEDLFNKYELNDKETNQVLLFIKKEAYRYNEILK